MQANIEKLNIRYLLTTRRPLLLTGILGLVSVLLLLAVGLPQVQQNFTLWNTWQKEKAARDQLRKKVAQLQQVSTDITADQAALVNTVMPSRKPLLELLSGLNQVALLTNVTFQTVELSPGSIATVAAETTPTTKRTGNTRKANQEYETLEVDLTVTGRLGDINRFFQQVEQVAPATTITALSLQKQAGRASLTVATTEQIAPADEVYEADMTVETYYFTKSISATLDSPLPTIGAAEQALLEQMRSYTKGSVQTQDRIEGGGLQDLFGSGIEELFKQQSAVGQQTLLPAASPTPATEAQPSI